MFNNLIEDENYFISSFFFFLVFEKREEQIEADESSMLIDIFVCIELLLNFVKAPKVKLWGPFQKRFVIINNDELHDWITDVNHRHQVRYDLCQ
jgi:hypothetical protein